MKLYKRINKRLEEIYDEFKKDKLDLTGWSLMQKIKEEANFEESLENFLIYRLFEIALNKKEIINIPNLIKLLIVSKNKKEKISIEIEGETKDYQELYRGVYLKKGALTQILKNLKLVETLDFFIKFIILEDEKINPKYYVGEKLTEKYSKDKKEFINYIINTFEKEYGRKKLKEKGRILKMKYAQDKILNN